jgi:flagellar basal-body rod modification protein FlgD
MNFDVNPVDSSAYFGVTLPKPKEELNAKTFIRLLSAQLANQNPLEPMKDNDFFAQLAQMGQVNGIDNMQKSLKVSQAAALMGKTVTALRPFTESTGASQNGLVQGKVVRMAVQNGEYYLTLQEADGGWVDVKLENIQEVAG